MLHLYKTNVGNIWHECYNIKSSLWDFLNTSQNDVFNGLFNLGFFLHILENFPENTIYLFDFLSQCHLVTSESILKNSLSDMDVLLGIVY